jgi:hypothetical protein
MQRKKCLLKVEQTGRSDRRNTRNICLGMDDFSQFHEIPSSALKARLQPDFLLKLGKVYH